jgi:hypothetical protein
MTDGQVFFTLFHMDEIHFLKGILTGFSIYFKNLKIALICQEPYQT